MSVSEFAFLVMGLVLGLAVGAALIEILRSRPAPPREVKVTVATDAVPRRRATTLADDGFADPTTPPGPAPGGPADRGEFAAMADPPGADHRTPVRHPVPGRIETPTFPLADPARHGQPAQAVPVSGGADPMLTALRASAAASAVAAMRSMPAATAVRDDGRASVDTEGRAAVDADAPAGAGGGTPTAADAPRAVASPRRAGSPARAPAPVAPPPASVGSGPCDEARHVADERCELADRARAQAATAEEAHRAAQRAYDEHEAAAAAAATSSDARAVRRAKDEAQARFRAGRAAATTTEEVEAAARAWLIEINTINAEAREALGALARERQAAQSLALALERTAIDADAARIAAETASAACLAARQAVADCEERETGGLPGSFPAIPSLASDDEGRGDPLTGALTAGGAPRIFRMLRGDRGAMQEMVAALAGEDPRERRRWQVALSDLVDAILADSLASTALDFPTDHPFWGPFTRAQDRDIASALSSLGFRFDGLGGWVDGRVPSQRDLSLAVGYAGLDPMRIRHWPNESEMVRLYEDVAVSATEHLAGAAPDLTLGELVTMLGRRADGLADVWNTWGRIRPLLLDGA